MVHEFMRNDWLWVYRYKLMPGRGFDMSVETSNNLDQANYIVYREGSVSCSSNGQEVFQRTAGETTDSSVLELGGISSLRLTAGADGADFFCISRIDSGPLQRLARHLQDAETMVTAREMVFLVSGTVSDGATSFTGPAFVPAPIGTTLQAVGPVFITEIWQ